MVRGHRHNVLQRHLSGHYLRSYCVYYIQVYAELLCAATLMLRLRLVKAELSMWLLTACDEVQTTLS